MGTELRRVTFLFLFHHTACICIAVIWSASATGNYRLRRRPEIRERTSLIVISGTAARADPASSHSAGSLGTLIRAYEGSKKRVR